LGLVDDAKTGLQWEQPVSTDGYTWETAKAYCEGKGAGWRMPTKAELESIVDDTVSNPAIDQNAFPNTPSVVHWSSTPFAAAPAGGNPAARLVWRVNFSDGQTHALTTGEALAIRCVRSRR
jgi:hypothetical protein